jgi:8-oxo-dGTP diphosphatase
VTYTYDYPRPAVTMDVVLFRVLDLRRLQVLLIQRRYPPFKNRWALPGGFLDIDEEIEAGARRELLEETGLEVGPLVELGTYGTIGRDPRGRVVSVVFLAVDARGELSATAGDDAAKAEWFSLRRLPKLAFDHNEVLADARKHLREMSATPKHLLQLLPRRFEITEVQGLFQAAAGETVAASTLARRLVRAGLLARVGNRPDQYRVVGRR